MILIILTKYLNDPNLINKDHLDNLLELSKSLRKKFKTLHKKYKLNTVIFLLSTHFKHSLKLHT